MHFSLTHAILLALCSICTIVFGDPAIERHFRLACDKKIPHEYLNRYARIICVLEAMGGDLKTNKIPETFVQLVGPGLGRAEVLTSVESFLQFYCSSSERIPKSSYITFITKFYQINGTVPRDVIGKCSNFRTRYNRLMHEEICDKKNPIARETQLRTAECFKETEITPNCTQPLTRVAKDASYIIEYICSVSDESNIVKYDDSIKCLGKKSFQKLIGCIDRMIKKIDAQ